MSIRQEIQGQTILELLVAVTLIILFLSGVVIVQLYAIRNVQFAQNKSQATKLAEEQIERARVIRDSAGVASLSVCNSSCFINSELTPVPISPTGAFGQSLQMSQADQAECPPPEITITPQPIVYRLVSNVTWLQGTAANSPNVSLSSCITDWR